MRLMPRLMLAAAGLFFLSGGSTAFAASFNCDAKELKADEKVICDTRTLNDADVRMATSFELLTGLLAMGSRGALQEQQASWLKRRQDCNADAACIQAAYDARMKQLDEAYKSISRPL